ncbi:hypothetical protein ABXQ82_09225 [Algibacter sp. 2305UL17-15]
MNSILSFETYTLYGLVPKNLQTPKIRSEHFCPLLSIKWFGGKIAINQP